MPGGGSKVPNGGLSPRIVSPACAGIQNVPNLTTYWIPSFAGMTIQGERPCYDACNVIRLPG